jgi:tetratricopeptide (TPR) repeat protein
MEVHGQSSVKRILLYYQHPNPRRALYIQAFYGRGNSLQELEKHDEAVSSYDQVIKLDPSHWRAYDNRGNSLVKLESREAALDSYSKSIKLNPQESRQWKAYSNRGMLYDEIPDFIILALKDYSRSLELLPDKPSEDELVIIQHLLRDYLRLNKVISGKRVTG